MKPVIPPTTPCADTVVFAKDQPQYLPLPVNRFPDGTVMCEWLPTPEERELLLNGGKVRMWMWTFGHPLQPSAVEVVSV